MNKEPFELQLPVSITQISAGNQFAVLLGSNGNLYSFGDNDHGQLGLGHQKMKIQPELIRGFSNQKFTQVSCGFKHVIAKTSLHKLYTWGWGEYGQLATGNFTDVLKPQNIDVSPAVTDICACMKSTIILIENSNILWCGTNETISYQNTMTKLKI